MVQSILYTLDELNNSWKKVASETAPPKSRPQDHAEVKLHSRYTARILASPVSALIQDAAPCEACHAAFIKYSSQTKFVFAIGKMGSGKEQGGTGYPALPGTIAIPTYIDDNGQELISTASQYVLKRPMPLDPSALPALFFYANGACYIGGVPASFSHIDQNLFATLLRYAE